MNGCHLCNVKEESANHVTLHYAKMRTLWPLLFYLFDERVLPSIVRETLLHWHETFVRKNCRKAWRVAPLCLF